MNLTPRSDEWKFSTFSGYEREKELNTSKQDTPNNHLSASSFQVVSNEKLYICLFILYSGVFSGSRFTSSKLMFVFDLIWRYNSLDNNQTFWITIVLNYIVTVRVANVVLRVTINKTNKKLDSAFQNFLGHHIKIRNLYLCRHMFVSIFSFLKFGLTV